MAKSVNNSNYTVVDLFCGVGGLTHGFVKEGFNVVAGIDFDKSCKYAFEKNNNTNFIYKDITTIPADEINALYPNGDIKILVGCAPCQPFSKYKLGKKSKDEKWKLLYSFSEIIKSVRPSIVSMENVSQLQKYNNGKVLGDFIKSLEALNYKVKYYIVNAQDYGVPQRRKRLLLFASLLGDIEIIKPTHSEKPKTVANAIKKLPRIKDGEICATDPLHRARKLSPTNKKRIIATPLGGSWKDWDESLIVACHKKDSGKEFGSVYGRMKWNEPSPTLTTYCTGLSNGRYGHPNQHRAISLREAALLQSFPKYYDFIDKSVSFSTANISRQIGNAVPVQLGKVVARTIKRHLTQHNCI